MVNNPNSTKKKFEKKLLQGKSVRDYLWALFCRKQGQTVHGSEEIHKGHTGTRAITKSKRERKKMYNIQIIIVNLNAMEANCSINCTL